MRNRCLKAGAVAEFKDRERLGGKMLMVGEVIAFSVVHYTHAPGHALPRVRGRISQNQRIVGELVMVRMRVFHPSPRVEGNIYTMPTKRTYRASPVWVPAKHLTSFLHVAPDRAGDVTRENLITVARNC